MRPLRILHCHSTFGLGGKEARAVRLMNVFGDAAEHTILSASPDEMSARDAIESHVKVTFPGDTAPSLIGKPEPWRYHKLSRYMQAFDLVLTYNWGAMDAVGARRLYAPVRRLPPLIHHEDGFNADEAVKLNPKRNGYRRLMLPTAHGLVVVSSVLETIALDVWKQPAAKLHRIANGIPTAPYAILPAPDAIPGLVKQPGDIIIGSLAGLRPVKDLPRLVEAVAPLPHNVKLVIVGRGPEREAIIARAAALGMADRLILPGFMGNPQDFVGLFDIFALSSQSEQFPISVVEGMAAGLPIVSTDVGDVMQIVNDNNRFAVTSDPATYGNALARLVTDAALRASLGQANRAKAVAAFDESAMIARYRELYWRAAGR